eukprot:1557281-Pleurochrysis_carterae.AAC.2
MAFYLAFTVLYSLDRSACGAVSGAFWAGPVVRSERARRASSEAVQPVRRPALLDAAVVRTWHNAISRAQTHSSIARVLSAFRNGI